MSLRELKIKTSSLKRVIKDEQYYLKDAADQEKHIEKLRADGADEYVIKKQIEVLDETRNMLPSCKDRIARAVQDLKALVDSNNPAFDGTEELASAKDALASITYDS